MQFQLASCKQELRGCPVLLFANKSDLPAARSASQIATAVGVTGEAPGMDGRAWHIG